MLTPFSTKESTASSSSCALEYTPRLCSIQSQLVRSELFSYCPILIHLNPASNIRVHQRWFHGRYGSRGRSEFMPNPSWIWDERLGGTWLGARREPCARDREGNASNKAIPQTNKRSCR